MRRGFRVATWEETLEYGAKLPRGLLPPMAGAAGFTAVQGTGAAAATATFGAGPTKGNLLVTGAWASSAGAAITMTSGGWTPLTSAADGTSFATRMFWKIAGAGESSTVTVSGATDMAIQEYASPAGVVRVVDNARVEPTNVNTYTSQTVTPPAGALAVVCGYFGVSGNSAGFNTLTVNGSSTGVNTRDSRNSSSGSDILIDLFVASTSGGYNASVHAASGSSVPGTEAIAVFYVVPSSASFGNQQAVRRTSVR